jgi:hypothetical protein
MRKTTAFTLSVFLLFSGCRTAKTGEKNYLETEAVEYAEGNESLEEERTTVETKTEVETKTAEIYEKTKFYPPSVENPKGGTVEYVERKIYLTDEKLLNETVSNYEKRLAEKDSVIASLKKDINLYKSVKVENDSRPVQGMEWLWTGIALLTVVVAILSGLYFYYKRNEN